MPVDAALLLAVVRPAVRLLWPPERQRLHQYDVLRAETLAWLQALSNDGFIVGG
jgi:hypothetical protein